MITYNPSANKTTLAIGLAAAFLSATPVMAAPAIQGVSGTLSTNSSITITGSGFGTNALDLDWLGDSIEGGTTGSVFAKAGWSTAWDFEKPKYTTDQKHSSSKSLKCTPLPATSWNCVFAYKLPNPVTAGQTLYATWWVRKDSASNTGQWKMLRLSGQETIVDGAQQLTMFNWPNSQYQLVINPGQSTDQSFWFPENVYPAGDNNWYRMELKVQASSTNQANGVATVTRYDGKAVSSASATFKSHVSSGDTYSYVIFQNYEGNGMGTSSLWFDDILIQKGSAARVELCDSPTWSSRTHCEVQVPTSWSSGSITVKAQSGSFTSGGSAYLYVVDAAGSVGGGVKMSVGSTANTTSGPTPPNTLTVTGTN